MSTRQEKLKSKKTEKAKSGRGVKYKPNEDDRKKVEIACVIGLPIKRIAKLVGIAEETLRKNYSNELENAVDEKNAAIVETLYEKAIGGCTASLIFWCKTRMGWKETEVREHVMPVMRMFNRGKTKND